MAKPIILVLGDEEICHLLQTENPVRTDNWQTAAVDSAPQAVQRIGQGDVDVVLANLNSLGTRLHEFLKQSRQGSNPPEIILLCDENSTETACQALNEGGRDFLVKPCHREHLRLVIHSCLEQRRLIEENRQLRTENRLYRNGRNIASQMEIDKLFTEALNVLLAEVDSNRGLAYAIQGDSLCYSLTSPGIDDKAVQPLAQQLARLSGADDEFRYLHGADLSEIHPLPDDLRSALLFPLSAADDMQGAIVLFNRYGVDLPEPTSRDNLLFLTEQLTLGFRNACQYRGTRELIYTDDLTDLFNQRYLKIAIDQELHRAERYGLEFTLAFIDLDYFKTVNDTHGHLVGSSILRQVAKVLRDCVREADMLFRYGGDEFTALLVETSSSGAAAVAERIRRRLEDHSFEVNDGQSCQVTATIGYATYPGHATIMHDLIELADKAMYQGKVRRNSTCSASELRQR
ncbi:MAG: diguanylate cyclase [Desulfuromonadales bacterium]|nr:diguanylate cyclase [Desulfuromonadales bacterium]